MSWLLCSRRCCRLLRSPSADGIDPLSRLSRRFSVRRLVMSPSAAGIDPVRLFLSSQSRSSRVCCPNAAGIPPFRLLSCRYSVLRLSMSANQAGTLPVNPLLCSLIRFRLVMPVRRGIGPPRLLPHRAHRLQAAHAVEPRGNAARQVHVPAREPQHLEVAQAAQVRNRPGQYVVMQQQRLESAQAVQRPRDGPRQPVAPQVQLRQHGDVPQLRRERAGQSHPLQVHLRYARGASR